MRNSKHFKFLDTFLFYVCVIKIVSKECLLFLSQTIYTSVALSTGHEKVMEIHAEGNKCHSVSVNLLGAFLILIFVFSDKTVRVWRWNVGSGFEEESFSPLLGHRYGVTSVRVSPQVNIQYVNYRVPGGILAHSSWLV